MLDGSVLNSSTFGIVKDELAGLLFAGLCGKNRGIFVLDPGDGAVYGCGKFPAAWRNEAVASSGSAWDSNGVISQFDGGNMTAEEAVATYGKYVSAVYATGDRDDAHACDA